MAALVASPWDPCMSDDDSVERFNERSTAREQLFRDAARRFNTTQLSSPIWAFFQVADLNMLREFTHSRVGWESVYLSGSDGCTALNEIRAKDTISLWSQHYRAIVQNAEDPIEKQDAAINKRSHSIAFLSTPAGPPRSQDVAQVITSRTRSRKPLGGSEFSVSRSRPLKEKAKLRDGNRCVITLLAPVDVCHIYPWCAFGGDDTKTTQRVERFWSLLRVFWPVEKVNSWRSKIFVDPRNPNRGTETVKNMITLSASAHRLHSIGAFALRPVRITQDKTQLELEFHWLARREREAMARIGLLDPPDSTRGRTSSRHDYERLGRLDSPSSLTLLETGTKFTMTTDDPDDKPLPDPELLELQWYLQRVFSMSGAADWLDKDSEHDSDASVDAIRAFDQTSEVNIPGWLEDVQGLDDQTQTRMSSPDGSVVDGP
jgi:hypothetical protein